MLDKKFYEIVIKDPNVERNFCYYMQMFMDDGSSASLINDDFGHWAVDGSGIQNCPDSNEDFDKEKEEWKSFEVSTSFYIEKEKFSNSIGGALKIYAQRILDEWVDDEKS
jgi:hypothetical protein